VWLYNQSVGLFVGCWRIQASSIRNARALTAAGALGDATLVLSKSLKPEVAIQTFNSAFLPVLAAAALSASPQLGHLLGDRRLRAYLTAAVIAQAVGNVLGFLEGDEEAGQAVAEVMGPRTLAHLPGNPTAVIHQGADGSVVLDVPPTSSRSNKLGIDSYMAALRAAGRPGRPRGAPKPKGSGRRRIDLDKARAIRQMRQDGATLKEIALRHFPDIPPDSSAARGRISRHIEAADLDDLRS
jgi:hypothetical protein